MFWLNFPQIDFGLIIFPILENERILPKLACKGTRSFENGCHISLSLAFSRKHLKVANSYFEIWVSVDCLKVTEVRR